MAIFAKYDGIDGESKDAHHAGWIEILSAEWGAHRQDHAPSGQSRRRGGATVDDFDLEFAFESAAVKLQEACLRGVIVPKLDLEFTATFGGARVTYLAYELKNVGIGAFHVSGSGNDEAGPPSFFVSNTFEEIKVTYTMFHDTGAARGNVETEHRLDRRH